VDGWLLLFTIRLLRGFAPGDVTLQRLGETLFARFLR